ncbi:iron uptake porin [Thermoleptolyngbya oregonensis]|uniref:iron uptake porin n=1 Tax=Thermoleptolyngbya oregonensis TaxID=2303529 RepID=UPI00292E07B1|nr:iron uptake porin [Thermoleptolyngbya oregonensis]
MLSKVLWNSLLVTPAVLGAALVSAIAPASAQVQSEPSVATLDQVMQYSNEGRSSGALAQVTSVTEFSDVSPGDWAYEALAYLANSEAQGGLDCLEGYPDGTYRGGRAMTRYEFAAGLASCLDAVVGRLESLDPEALARIEALQREFAAELAVLRGRVDALEAAVEELQANQFSTTTRLSGTAIFAFSDAFGDSVFEDANNTVFQSRVRLAFNTSFTGQDRLLTRLQGGNFRDFVNVPGIFITPATEASNTRFFDEYGDFSFDSGGDFAVAVDRLEYRFPIGIGQVYLGAQGQRISDIVPTISSLDSGEQGALSSFNRNPIYDLGKNEQRIGFGVTLDLSDDLQLGLGYLTGRGNDPAERAGLFDGGYTAFGQLTFTPGTLKLGLTYTNVYSSHQVATGIFSPSVYNSYGISFELGLTDAFFIGGWGMYTDTRTFAGPLDFRGDGEAWSYALTLGLRDLGARGSLLGVIAGVPPYQGSFGPGGGGSGLTNTGGSFHAEVFYRFNVSDNISFTPGVIFVTDVADTGSDLFIPVLRTSFRF